ncbi:hypothetical protein N24_0273 [Corynebacterium suranareeae]|uniref:Uncharacterized protein n=1 Tax=Corynebacterium suranareeae TaxID=2506452 RepID=A0A160PMT5_9CORY|nr:hypothetical protein N24_0273 [Corynebacterium suranareeae]
MGDKESRNPEILARMFGLPRPKSDSDAKDS